VFAPGLAPLYIVEHLGGEYRAPSFTFLHDLEEALAQENARVWSVLLDTP